VPSCMRAYRHRMSQRMQSFALTRKEKPFTVVDPGKRPRVTLTPTLP
jgi:gamma-glutamyltranspeptidase/glutathione hydrolase